MSGLVNNRHRLSSYLGDVKDVSHPVRRRDARQVVWRRCVVPPQSLSSSLRRDCHAVRKMKADHCGVIKRESAR